MVTRGLAPLRVPDEFWERAEVIAALIEGDVSTLLVLIRRHTGASQSRIGAATGLSQGTISEIIHGKRSIASLEVLRRVAGGLGMPDGARRRLGLATDVSVVRPSPFRPDADIDPDSLNAALIHSSVGDRDLDFIEQATYALAQRYPTSGPKAIWPMVSAHLGRLHAIVARPQRLSISRRAVTLIGVLSGIAGNVWVDRGRENLAGRYLAVGRLAGHEVGDDGLAAWISALESIASFYARNPQYAASLLDQALYLNGQHGGRRRRAWISALRARAYAVIDADTAFHALADAYADLDRAEPPCGTDFFDKARLDGLAGCVHLLAGDTTTATTLMSMALAERPAGDVKGRALLSLDLAAARVRASEPEAACQMLAESLERADGQLVRPILSRAHEVVAGMARWRTIPAVRTLQDHLRALSRRPAAEE